MLKHNKLFFLLIAFTMMAFTLTILFCSAKATETEENGSESSESKELNSSETAPSCMQIPEGTVPIEPVIKPFQGLSGACIRHQGTMEEMGPLFGKLAQMTMERGMEIVGPPFGAYYLEEDNFDLNNMKYDVCFPVASSFEDEDLLKFITYHSLEQIAYYKHVGTYEQMGDIYWGLTAWFKQMGYKTATPSFEVYLVGPPSNVPPEQYETEIIVPLIKVEAE